MDRGMTHNKGRRITRSCTSSLTGSIAVDVPSPAKQIKKTPTLVRGSRRGRPKINEERHLDIEAEELLTEIKADQLVVEQADNNQVGSLSYTLLETQLWALLPSFCSQPSDIATSFPKMAKGLGNLLNIRKDLRLTIMMCLRRLVTYSCEKDRDEDKKVMSRFAKNYLPILFNIYTTESKGSDEEGIRLASLETVKVYLTIAPEDLRKELYDRVNLILEATPKEDHFVRESVLDLLRILIPFQPVSVIEDLFENKLSKMKDTKDHKQQKKYYRILEELCSSKSENCSIFFNSKMEQIKDLLLDSLSSSAPSSRGGMTHYEGRRITRSCTSSLTGSIAVDVPSPAKQMKKTPTSVRGSRRGQPKRKYRKYEGHLNKAVETDTPRTEIEMEPIELEETTMALAPVLLRSPKSMDIASTDETSSSDKGTNPSGQQESQSIAVPHSHSSKQPDSDIPVTTSTDRDLNGLEELDETNHLGQQQSQLSVVPHSHRCEEPVSVITLTVLTNLEWLKTLDNASVVLENHACPTTIDNDNIIDFCSFESNTESITDQAGIDKNASVVLENRACPTTIDKDNIIDFYTELLTDIPANESHTESITDQAGINKETNLPGKPKSQSHSWKGPDSDIPVTTSTHQELNWLEELDNLIEKERAARSTVDVDNLFVFNAREECGGYSIADAGAADPSVSDRNHSITDTHEGLDRSTDETTDTGHSINQDGVMIFNSQEEFVQHFNLDPTIDIPFDEDIEFCNNNPEISYLQLERLRIIQENIYQNHALKLQYKSTEKNKEQRVQTVTPRIERKAKNNDFWYRFTSPYFKDRYNFPAWLNNEAKRRNKLEIKPLSQYIREGRNEFDKTDDEKLLTLIKQQLIEKHSALLESKKKCVQRMKKLSKFNLKEIAEIDEQIVKTKDKTVVELLAGKNDWTFDWDRISVSGFDSKFSSRTCELYWNNYLKPSVNKEVWSKEEEAKLVDLVKKYNHENWVQIAEELGTNRSAIIVFKHYQQNFFLKSEYYKAKMQTKWSRREERDLIKWVESYKSNGAPIGWCTIGQTMGRSANAVQRHYAELIKPEIVKGRYSTDEDGKIMEAVEQNGLNNLALSQTFKQRTTSQISYRYKRLVENKTCGHWKPDEDEKLLQLVGEKGVGQWSSIAKAMRTRNRTQVRQRYRLLEEMGKNK